MNYQKNLFAILLMILCKDTYANSNLIPVQDIRYLNQTLEAIKQKSTIPVLFPNKMVPVSAPVLYASFSSYASSPDYSHYWQVNIDSTPECQGAKYCNIGSISAERDKHIEKNYITLPDRKIYPKQKIELSNHIIGYCAPFHVQASGVNPTIEWRIGDVVYTLQWTLRGSDEGQCKLLSNMVESIVVTHAR